MQELLEQLAQIAGKIKSIEDSREKLGAFLKEIKNKIELSGSDVVEHSLVKKVSPDSLLNKKVVAIDGGVSQNTYHGLDLILIKTVAVVSDYDKKLERTDYYPAAFPTPKVLIISDPFSEDEFIMNSSLERVKEEISLATTAAEKFSPDLLLLDGSVVPHSNDKPQKTSPLNKRYLGLLETFKKLYGACSSVLLVGCIEDSRARKFCEIISQEILSKIDSPHVSELQKILFGTRDTNLLYHILDYGERTCVFKYGETPVLRDLGEFGKRIYAFYLRTAENDRPLRIEFYTNNNPAETADKIASLILALSCHNSYGFPAPLTEADVRARLHEHDADALHDQLVDRVGITPSLMKLRRELRPL